MAESKKISDKLKMILLDLKSRMLNDQDLIDKIIATDNLNLLGNRKNSVLYYAVHYGDASMVNTILSKMSEDTILTKSTVKKNILHNVILRANIDNLKSLLEDQRILKLINDQDIYGRTPFDMVQNSKIADKKDRIDLLILSGANTNTIGAISDKPAILRNLSQGSINDKLRKYLNLMGRDADRIIDKEGACNGWSFLYLTWQSTGKENEFYDMLNLIANLKLEGTPQEIEEKLNSNRMPSSLKNNYSSVRDALEHVINDLAVFHSGTEVTNELNLALRQKSRVEQYDLIKDPALNRELSEVFHLSMLSYNKSQLTQMLDHFSRWPGLSIDVGVPQHSTALYIMPDGKFKYFDSNHLNKIKIFDNSEELAEHILQFSAGVPDTDANDSTEIRFNAYKFYPSKSDVPKIEVPTKSAPQGSFSTLGFNPLLEAIIQNDEKKINQHFNTMYSSRDIFGNTPLMWAVKMNNKALIERLLKKGGKEYANLKNHAGDAAVMMSVMNGSLDITKSLLSAGANVNILHTTPSLRMSISPLIWAALDGNAEMTRLVLQGVNNIDEPSPETRLTALIATTLLGDSFHAAKLLLDEGADVNAPDMVGMTPIIHAIRSKDLGVIRLFLERGANLDKDTLISDPVLVARNTDSVDVAMLIQTHALAQAIKKQDSREVQRLIQFATDVNSVDVYGVSLVQMAAVKGDAIILSQLAVAGANLDIQDANGYTPLMAAVRSGSIDAVNYLLNSQVEIEAPSNDGTTVLALAKYSGNDVITKQIELALIWRAIETGNVEKLKKLLEDGADVDGVNSGWTPLMLAALNGNADMVTILIQYGAEVDKTANTWTPLMLAASEGKSDVVRILIENRAKIDKKNENGDSPIMLVASNPALLAEINAAAEQIKGNKRRNLIFGAVQEDPRKPRLEQRPTPSLSAHRDRPKPKPKPKSR